MLLLPCLRRLASATLPLAFLWLATAPAKARELPWIEGKVVVKFVAEGDHALRECAETLAARGQAFRGATADRSGSLDRLHERLGVGRVRALFRRPDGRPFAEQRRRLGERFEAARARRAARAARAPIPGAELPDLAHVYVIELAETFDVGSAVALYRRDPHVEWAQPSYRIETESLVDGLPNDPFFASSGSWGQPYQDLWGLHLIAAAAGWPLTRGEGIVVAVNDTGLDYEHPDIAANVWVNSGEDLNGNGIVDESDENGVDDDGNGFVDDLRGFDFHGKDPDPFDDNGHGSHVAGIVAAVGDNGIGVLGVSPGARIMALKGIGADGSGEEVNLAVAIVYAAENGAHVINNSWSCGQRCPSNPVLEEAVELAHALGLVLVSSAGNRSDDVGFYTPQNMRETITVAATNPDDERAPFSNVGFLVDVAAPGSGFRDPPPPSPLNAVLSLLASQTRDSLTADGLRIVGGDYLRLAGTSMAAPHVAGLAALLLSLRPELTNDDVRNVLRLTAEDLYRPGHDLRSGAGRIDVPRALALESVPQVHAEILKPPLFEVVRLRDTTIEIVGTASGPDFREFQLFTGAGQDPEVWVPLAPPRSDVLEEGLLGVWELTGLEEEGAHVIRLSVTALDGQVVEAFAPLNLLRNPPRLIGSTGSADHRPDISGTRVVWESARSLSDEPEGLNLFITDLSDPDGMFGFLASGLGDERRAAISGTRVVWEKLDRLPVESATCGLEPESGDCEPRPLGSGSAAAPDVSGDRIVWMGDRGDGSNAVFFCEPDSLDAGCAGRPLAAAAEAQFNPAISESRVVWIGAQFPFQVVTCALDPATGDCPPQTLPGIDAIPNFPAVSGDLIAWLEMSFDFRQVVRLCELDPATGACPIVEPASRGLASAPSVSGDRVVWHDLVQGHDTDIFFCQYDRLTGACPVQRLTADPNPQLNPAIDGNWVVWEDNRNRASDIFGLELPSLEPIGDRRVDEDETLVIAVSGRDPLGDPVSLDAALADGEPVEAVGATFTDFGDGSGELRWEPSDNRAGSHAVRFTLTSTGLLRTHETIRMYVNQAPVVVTQQIRAERVGRDLVLDACQSFDPDGDALAFAWRDPTGSELGTSCELRLPARSRPAAFIVTLEVSDGLDVREAGVRVLWLPVAAVLNRRGPRF